MEHLAPGRAKLLQAVKQDDQVEKTWTIDGKVHCVLKGDPRKHIIHGPDDLFRQLGWSEDKMKQSGLFTDVSSQGVHGPLSKLSILSLNINGLKSKLDTGLLDLYAQNFDIICLTETKTDTPDLINTYLSEYKCYSIKKSSNNQKFGVYHGMCILMTNSIFDCSTLIQPTLSESVIWVKVESEFLGFSFIIGAVYLPCEGSIHYSQEVFDNLCTDIVNIKSKYDAPLCLLGDFNARTGLLDDFLDVDNFVDQSSLGACDGDLDNTDILNSRSNSDAVVNNSGKKVIEMCQSFDLRIVNGRVGSDQNIGKYTCFNKNGGCSAIDYAILSKRLFPLVQDFNVDVFDRCLSDVHCPIMLTLQFKVELNGDSLRNEIREELTGSDKSDFLAFQWNGDSMLDFRQHTKDCSGLMHEYVDQLEADVDQESIDIFYSHLCDMFLSTAQEIGVCKLKHYRNNRSKISNNQRKQGQQQPWFDIECREARKEYLNVKNRWKRKVKLLRNSDVPVDSRDYDEAGNSYRNLLRFKKRLYSQNLNKLLRSLRTNNPKEQWQLLNDKKGHKGKYMGNVL